MTVEAIVDAGDALAGDTVATTNNEIEEKPTTLNDLKTIRQEPEITHSDAWPIWLKEKTPEINSEQENEEVTDDGNLNKGNEEVVDDEDPNKKKEEKQDEEEEEEDDESDLQDDIAYIKDHPEKILELIQQLQENNFQNKWKKKYELEVAEKTELEKRYVELQKQKYADKYDDANLPVLEEKRPFWRAQNKFYENMENEANRNSYIRRLEEELEDIKAWSKTVSIEEKTKTKPEPKLDQEYKPYGRVWVKISKPNR